MDVHMSHFIHIFLAKIAPSAAVAVQCSKGRDAHPDPAGHLWIHGWPWGGNVGKRISGYSGYIVVI